ncbi:SDR family oxidoreductase [Hymenobacter sp. UV11]|uniref:SDR family oxidoreductase n=1 Tax=Hymenobacter sp. UV11 TaxID=1849735 RepID=UPI001060CD97|nr:SDR family oxidoreductase [Hymenobacter sp. UV11]TDN36819.1 NAD(P)-dependent oxidoreductase [Hymenobacter sp. UV11]TFZ63647.1 SDR family oxidoreductase [Hymenobacter sp. UV11]
MVLVTGATGQYGTKVLEHLLHKGIEAQHISALVRDAAKGQTLQDQGIELRVGDYADVDSLVQAFQGVDTLLLVSSNDRGAVENRTVHHLNVIHAAKAAQVKHLVYTSFVTKPAFQHLAIADFLTSHAQTEQAIKDSGLPYTILQNGIYLEMIPIFAGSQVAETGLILFPAQEGKASWVLRAELAEAAAHVLTTKGHKNQTYVLANTEATSFQAIAKDLSGSLGKDVRYQSPPVEEFQAILQQAGVPEMYIGMFTMWASAVAQGMMEVEDATLATFLGRQPTTTAQFIKQVYN